MYLNLSSGGNDLKKHIVIHEFGHALGLLHEHQRPGIWNKISKCIDPAKIDGDVIDRKPEYDLGPPTKYHAKSIMHYRYIQN